MTNKYLTFLTIATIGLSAATPIEAKSISPEEALSRMNKTNRIPAKARMPKASLTLSKTVYTQNTNEEAVYVFDNADGDGFVLLSADDALPAVLGYSDTGLGNADNAAPGFTWLLEQYAAQVEFARENNLDCSTRSEGDEKTPIEPLLTSMWDQDEPFNINAPTLTTTGKRHSAAGCVATAMAQVMYFYKYPAVGTGAATATWAGGDVVDNLAKYKLDWDNMLDDYSSGYYTEAQEKAAADLLYACGMSVGSSYGSTTTAKTVKIVTALCENFGYSKEMRYYFRDYIASSEEWENLVYGSLSRQRPVIYDGNMSGNTGHAFVCDGYQGDGYFHFNWGWSGVSDGYYLLDLLNPKTQGTGGFTDGYNDRQGIIIDIHPAVEGEKFEYQDPIFHYKGNLVFNEDNTFTGTASSSGFYNRSPQTAYFEWGILAVDSNGNETIMIKNSKEYACGKGTSGMKFESLGEDLGDGVFNIYPIYYVNNSKTLNYMYHDVGTNDYLTFTIEKGVIIDVTPGYNTPGDSETGIAMVKDSGIKIVSSSGQNGFTVTGVTEPTNVNVYGIAGESVLNAFGITTDTTFSLDNASSGIYIVTATNRNGTATLKIIKR